MGLAFHAAPPEGHWINDPNALFAVPGGYRLLAQHRADAPGFRETGWGAFESADLLGWTWRGVALPPDPEGWAYSGSAVRVERSLELFHTVHDPGTGLQHQRHLTGEEGGWRRAPDDPELAGPAANRRDPFVFAWGDEWRMLLTRSCDWHGWREDAPSHLVVLASPDRERWRVVGRIGPWDPPGVMWEVPVLVRAGGADLLFVSLVDRRGDGAACSVRGWIGWFDGATFHPDPDFPAEGQPIDLGPDFYALMPGVDGDWAGERPFVAWAASWRTAREPIWPGFAGGPITLPRSIEVRRERGRPRLAVTPWPGLAERFRPVGERPKAGRGGAEIDGGAPFELVLEGEGAALHVSGDPGSGRLVATRTAPGAFAWSAEHEGVVAGLDRRRLTLFVDGPLIELFDETSGASLTAALPGGARAVRLEAGGEAALAWSAYAP